MLCINFYSISRSLSLFEWESTPDQTQTELDPKVYLLLPQAVYIAGSDASIELPGSGFAPASGFFMQNH